MGDVSAAPLPVDPVAEDARLWREAGGADVARGLAAVASLMRAQAILQGPVGDVPLPLAPPITRAPSIVVVSFPLLRSLPAGRALASTATALLNEQVFSRPDLSSARMRRLVETVRELRRSAGDFAG